MSEEQNVDNLLDELAALRAENARLKALITKTIHESNQHKSTEVALQQSEERFKTQLKNLPLPTYTWRWEGADLVLRGFNDAADRYTEGAVRKIIGKSVAELYQDRPRVAEYIRRCYSEKTTLKDELPYKLSSGVVKDIVVTYVYAPPDLVIIHTEDVTESKRAASQLRESEERFRTLFENAPIGLGVADENGTLLEFNEEMMRPGGYTREDILKIGNVAALYAYPEERDRALKLARQQGFLRRHEVHFRRKDGSVYPALMSLQPIIVNGKRGWQSMCEDISERKQLASALNESETRLNMALEAGKMGFWHRDLRTGKAVASSGHAQIHGSAEPFPTNFEDFLRSVHPDDVAYVQETVRNAGANHLPIVMDYRVIWRDGSVHWIASRGIFIYDDAGNPIQSTGITMDITERKLAEEKLKKSEANLREAQNLAKIGYWEWDARTDTSSISDEILRVVGLPPGASMNMQQFFESVIPEDRERAQADVAEAMKSRGTYTTEVRVPSVNGEVRTLLSKGKVICDSNGNVLGMRGTTQDITERKQFEAHLLQAQKIESIGRLAGGIAHDFNNLLTGIMGYTELLALKAPSGVKPEIDGIRQISHRAASLTRQLLGFARKQNVEARVINLNDLIISTTHMLSRLIGEHIALTTNLSASLHNVKVDGGQFEQILMNLAVNARDAMPQGGTLTIQAENLLLNSSQAASHGVPPGNYACIRVVDSGPGMTSEVLDHLFEPFFTTKPFGKGSGLGLATCYGIVKQYGGDIWAESTAGAGSRFSFILPAAQGKAETIATDEPKVQLVGTERILLVEDEPEVRSTAAAALRASGYIVTEASDGKEALRIYETATTSFHLLISDVVMPRMNGTELATLLRKHCKDLPVIFMSGYTQDEIVNTAVFGEHMRFLQKPFTPGMLLLRVREVLDQSRTRV